MLHFLGASALLLVSMILTSMPISANGQQSNTDPACFHNKRITHSDIHVDKLDRVETAFLHAATHFIPMFDLAGNNAALSQLRTQLALPTFNCTPKEIAQANLLGLLTLANRPFDSETILEILDSYADGFLPDKFWQHGFSKLEAVALYSYTTEDYQLLNPELRRLTPRPDALHYSAMVNRALDRLPRHKGLVKRGLSLPDDQIPHYQVGKQIVLPSFTSATADLTFGAFEKIHRFLISSCEGREVSTVSANPGEREVLFKAGSQFEVTDIKYDAPLHGFVAAIEFHLKEIGCTDEASSH